MRGLSKITRTQRIFSINTAHALKQPVIYALTRQRMNINIAVSVDFQLS